MFKIFLISSFFSLVLAACLYQIHIEIFPGERNSFLKASSLTIWASPSTSNFPGVEETVTKILKDLLKEKGIIVISSAEKAPILVDQAPSLDANISALSNLRDQVGTNFLLAVTLLDYRQAASSIRSGIFQTWDGMRDEYFILPTYLQGDCYIKIRLLLWDLEKKLLAWKKEGKISGPTFASGVLIRKLLRHLLADFPT